MGQALEEKRWSQDALYPTSAKDMKFVGNHVRSDGVWLSCDKKLFLI